MRRWAVSLVVIVVVAGFLFTGILRAGAVFPANEHFQRTWARTDQPVREGLAGRTWMWGPTNLTGELQVGDEQFEQRQPAQVNVGGDGDDPAGPTYATFSAPLKVEPAAPGATITKWLARSGQVTEDPALANRGQTVARIDDVTIHAIAAPFWSFMTSSGTTWDGDSYYSAPLFENPYFATGRPITEAYWANVKIAGSYQDVLMQCFERRCLTYNPANALAWQVEAGNVGQHYYAWRYDQPGGEPIATPDTATEYEPVTASRLSGPSTER